MTNIIPFPKSKPKVFEIVVEIEWQILEDGTAWYRTRDIKSGEWLEWYELEVEE